MNIWRLFLGSAAVVACAVVSPGLGLPQNVPTITSAVGVFFSDSVPGTLPGTVGVTAGTSDFRLVLTGTGFDIELSRLLWIPSSGPCEGCTLFPEDVTSNGTRMTVIIPSNLIAAADLGAKVAVANGSIQSANFAFPVNPAPNKVATVQAGTVGVPYSAPVLTGGTAPYNIFVEGGALPPGLAISGGNITGTPTTAGTYNFLLILDDAWFSLDGDSQNYTLVINPVSTSGLRFTPNAGVIGEVGAFYQQALTGVGGSGPYTFALATGSVLPAGLTLTSAGVVTGVPAQAGGFIASIVVRDAQNATGTGTLSLNILPAVQISTNSLPSAVPPAFYSAQLQAFGGQGPYTWSLVSGTLPSGLVLNSSTGVISGTPDLANTTGSSFTVQVRDFYGGTASRFFTISINIAPPVITNGNPLPNGTTNVAFSQTLTATGGTGGYTWALTGGSLPPGLSMASTGVITGTPTTAGAYSFSVQVSDDGARTSSKSFNLTINPPPVSITTTTLPDTPGGAVSIPLAASGGTPPYTWSLVSGSLPAGLTLSVSGVIAGVTDAIGTFNFRVQVIDSKGGLSRQDLTLRTTPGTLVITSTSPLPAGKVGTAYSTNLSGAGGVKPYVWSASGLPAGLAIDAATGVISGTPTADAAVTVAVVLTDSRGTSATANFTLDIAPPPLAIIATTLPDATAGLPYAASFEATGGARPYSWLITGALPSGLLISSDGRIAGTPQSAGNANFTVVVSDSRGSSANRDFTLVVAGRPLTVLTTSLPGGVTGQTYSQTLSAAGGKPPYTWSGSVPAGLTLSASGVISGAATVSGATTIAATVTDSDGATASHSYPVVFSLPPPPPVTITGLPATSDPLKQGAVQVSLTTPYPVLITGTLTLTFRADIGGDDPAVQLSTGGRVANFTIPANTLNANFGVPSIALQTGTVAGLITLTVGMQAAGADVTPNPPPTSQVRVNPSVPVVTSVRATRSATGVEVQIVGYSPTRELTQGVFRFDPASGGSLQTTSLTVALDAAFNAWYASAASAPFGSQFAFTQPFTVQGNLLNVGTVTVTISNRLGASQSVTATVQ